MNLNDLVSNATYLDKYKKTAVMHEESDTKHVFVFHDEEPMSPRNKNWGDTLGTMLYVSDTYILGDERIGRSALALIEGTSRIATEEIIFLPTYAYIHGNTVMSTSPFGCRFDSGQAGIIYVTKAKAREWLGVKKLSAKHIESIKKSLVAEVETFSRYLSGEVYGFKSFDKSTGDELESCWGFYGINDVKEAVKEALL